MSSTVPSAETVQKYNDADIERWAEEKRALVKNVLHGSDEDAQRAYDEFKAFAHQQDQKRIDQWQETQNNYFYRGDPTAADRDIQRYRAMAGQARGRGEIQADYSQADLARALGMQARGEQSTAVGLYRDAATGRGPSAAQNQFQSGLDASIRAQQSSAASARGGGVAMAAAQRAAMQNAGQIQAQGASEAAQLRAREMQAAMAGYAQASSQQRGQDVGLQDQEAKQASAQATLRLQSRGQNDQVGLAYEGMGQSVTGQEMSGNLAFEADKRARYNAEMGYAQTSADRANAASERADARNERYASGLLSGVSSGLYKTGRAYADDDDDDDDDTSDRRAKTDVRPADAKVQSFLDALRAHDYRYKRPDVDGPGRRVSVMAQELEKSELGRRMVDEAPDGTKQVDYRRGLATMLASMATMNDRVNDLEAALAARHGRRK